MTMPHDLSFGAPAWLWAWLVVPALAALFGWAEFEAQRRLTRLIRAPRLRAQLTGAASAGRRRTRFALLLAGMACLILALAAPRWGYETRDTHRQGLDLIVIADVSKSMLATDVTPNRLTRARLAIQDLVGMLEGDRLGLVAFAGTAFLQAPLTLDYDAILTASNELDPELIPRGGTNFGAAIDLALDAFGKAEAGNRAIILLSDGEPTAEGEQAKGLQAAARAAEAGVRIFTVGFGTPEGSLIPLDDEGNFVRAPDGQVVKTKLDAHGLTQIAKAANGFYTPFTSGTVTMQTVLQQGLRKLKTGEIDARMARRPIERFQWPLGVGLLCLAVATALGQRRKMRAPAAGGGAANASTRKGSPSAVAVAAVAGGLLLATMPLQAADPASTPPPPADSAPDLYRQGKYGEAYRAFQELAKQNPQMDSLQFNAGASAYMGKQYDDALDAFAKTLVSKDAALQAKAHYNFGNTLFRRGEDQKDPQAKIKDWRNAIEHYNSTLGNLKSGTPSPSQALAANTTFNRDVVQKRLDELLKQQKDEQKQKQDKKDKRDKKDQQDSKPGEGGNPSQKPDGQSDPNQSQSSKPDPKQPGDKGDPSQQQQPPAPDAGPSPDQKKDDGKSPPPSPGQTPPDDKSGQSKDLQNDAPKNDPSANSPPESSKLNQDQPRQHGDFEAKPGEGAPSPTPDAKGEPTPGETAEESGKMSQSQARALLDSLKDEERHVNLGDPNHRKQQQDDPVAKDW